MISLPLICPYTHFKLWDILQNHSFTEQSELLPTDQFIFQKGEGEVSTSVQVASECFIKHDSLAQFLPRGVHVANRTTGLINKT